jgi:hypothetical protein
VYENNEIIHFRILTTKKSTFFKWKFTSLLRTFVITRKLVSVQKITHNYEPKLLRVSHNYDVKKYIKIMKLHTSPTPPPPYHHFYPQNLNTIAYFRSFFLVITSIMVTNFRNYEASELRVSKNVYEKMSTYA